MLKHNKIKIFILVSVLAFLPSALFAQDSRYDADKNLPFNEDAGDVNPQTGNLSLQYTDLSLPGRGGMNFTFGRIWSLNQANVYHMYQDADSGINRLSADTIERVNRMGVGWSSNIPYILDDDKSGELVKTLFFAGNAYQVDYQALSFRNGPLGNETASNLLGYDFLDLRIYQSLAISYGDAPGGIPAGYGLSDGEDHSSRFVLILKDNSRYYFREDGKLMMNQDKSGVNRIWYFYETPAGEKASRLSLVSDTVGRHIRFAYNEDGCLASLAWDVTRGIKTAQTRRLETEERRIRFEYESLENHPLVKEIKQSMYQEDRLDSFVLQSVFDSMGFETRYTYAEAGARFTFNSAKPLFMNVYMLLTSVAAFYDGETGSYRNKRCFEYAVPARGLYTKYFYNGFMENHRLSRQYSMDKNRRVCLDTSYVYHQAGENGNSNQYSSVIKRGGVTSRYLYLLSDIKSLQHVLSSIVMETGDGFLERRDFLYDENRAKVQEDVYRQGTWVYREKFSYDKKGNPVRVEDREGLVTCTRYDDKYNLPVSVVRILHEEGEKREYLRESEVNPLTGNIDAVHIHYTGIEAPLSGTAEKELVSTTRFEYDIYGNKITETDSLGNSLHTVYDKATHALPVKIWQDVDIDSWSGGGDVHSNWLRSPEGKSRIRIRNWRVFNSDGTVWLEIDNEGYAIEHYYNAKGEEVEQIKPGLDDLRDFARPLRVDDEGNTQAPDFDDFLAEYTGGTETSVFSVYFASRVNNAGVRTEIDYPAAVIDTEIDLDKEAGDLKRTTRRYDGLEHLLEEVEYSAEGEEYVMSMVYDNLGRMVALTDQDRGAALGVQNMAGTVFDRYESTWQMEYDDLGRKKMIVYPATRPGISDVKRFYYDDVRNSIETVDPEKQRLLEVYDWNGNVIESVLRGGAGAKPQEYQHYLFEYDELNRKVKFTDAMGIITRYRYDERDLLVEQDYGNGSDRQVYNSAGLLVKKRDRKNQYITMTYDSLGRNTNTRYFKTGDDLRRNNPDNYEKISYDNRGNAIRIENNHLIEHYIYDYDNQVIKLQRRLKDEALRAAVAGAGWDGEAGSQVFDFSYTYNDAGMLKEMTYPDGNTHFFEYDNSLGRLRGIKDGPRDFISGIEYNKSGVVTRMEYANDTWQKWEFDNRKRIQRIAIGNAGDELVNMQYTLDGAGNILSINDNEYGYDDFNRLTSAKTLNPGQVDRKKLVLKHFGAYLESPAGKKEGILAAYNPLADLNDDGRVNGLDDIRASLIDDSELYDQESFRYDKNGNRTRLVQNGTEYIYTYGERNRLLKIEKKEAGASPRLFVTYTYDANGNTRGRKIYAPDGVTVNEEIVFEYDVLNCLVKTVETTGNDTNETFYYYDNAGNRFVKQNPKGTSVYLRHGQVAVAMDLEIPGPGFDFKGEAEYIGKINRYVLSGNLLAGRITTKIFSEDSRESGTSWYHLDHLNSTKCVTGEDGAVDVLYEYRAFGEELKKLGTGDAGYTYGGKELDRNLNLYYFNARYYDATTGRFINVDPVQDGTNWYVYCCNNPLRLVDPTGLESRKLNDSEIQFLKSIIGEKYDGKEIDYTNIKITSKSGRAGSMPWSTIYMTNPMGGNSKKSVFAHEMFHQFQYQTDVFAFPRLIGEQINNERGISPYNYGDISKIEKLSDIKTLEGQGQFIEDFTLNYLNYKDYAKRAAETDNEDLRRIYEVTANKYREDAAQYSKILENSDMESEAINELNNKE